MALISPVVFFMFLYGIGGNEKQFLRKSYCGLREGFISDYDGNVYRTVKIGSQIWMAENLKTAHYRNGIRIPNFFNEELWTNTKTGAYCLNKNDSVGYKKTYGALYNFYAVADSNNLCPEGWHVPTQSECMTLINYLGGKDAAGIRLKDNRTGLWNIKDKQAGNESGFSGLPAGGRGKKGPVDEVGNYATWWSSSSVDSLYAWHWGLYPDRPGIRSNPGHKASGFSVRCIKD